MMVLMFVVIVVVIVMVAAFMMVLMFVVIVVVIVVVIAFMMMLVFVIVVVIVMMATFVLVLILEKILDGEQEIGLFNRLEDFAGVQFIPRGGYDSGARIVFAKQRDGLVDAILRSELRAA